MATLPKLSQAELEKKEAIVGVYRIEPISREMHFVAKMLFFGGWQMVKDYHLGVISHKSAQELVEAVRNGLESISTLRHLTGCTQALDSKSFNKGMKSFTDRIKVE